MLLKFIDIGYLVHRNLKRCRCFDMDLVKFPDKFRIFVRSLELMNSDQKNG